MSAQVKLPVKKKIQWKGFIGLLGSHSIQMYNWPRNLLLEDVFLVNYSQKDTTFWDKLWAACQGQLGLQHLPSGSDILVVDNSGHALLTVDQGKSFSTRKQGHEEVDSENEVDTHNHEQNPRSSQCHKPSQYHNAASSSSTLPQCQKKGKSCVVDENRGMSSQCHKAPHHCNATSSSMFPQCQGQKKGKSCAVDEHGGKSSQYHKPPHHHNAPSSSSTFPQCQGQNVVQSEELLVDEVGGVNGHSVSGITMASTVPSPHFNSLSMARNTLDIPGPSTFIPATIGSPPVQFNLNSEIDTFAGTTSGMSQVVEDPLSLLQYNSGQNWMTSLGEGQFSSDSGALPFFNIESLLSNPSYTEFGDDFPFH